MPTGIISRRPGDECRRLTEQILASMLHEPFHTSGFYCAPDLGVFPGWVALKGAFAAGQPILGERGDVGLVLADECFSDSEAQARGRRCQDAPSCHAQWLAGLYEERGDKFFADLNGLFSGLLVDRRQGRAVPFNDRYGSRTRWRPTRHRPC